MCYYIQQKYGMWLFIHAISYNFQMSFDYWKADWTKSWRFVSRSLQIFDME